MEKIFKIMLLVVLALMIIFGVAGIVQGIMQKALHGVLIGAFMLAIPYAWYKEEHSDD